MCLFYVAHTIVYSDNRYQITKYYRGNNIFDFFSKIRFTYLFAPIDFTSDQNIIENQKFIELFEAIFTHYK